MDSAGEVSEEVVAAVGVSTPQFLAKDGDHSLKELQREDSTPGTLFLLPRGTDPT